MHKPKQVFRCRNKEVHYVKEAGKILAIFDGNAIYLHCKDRACKRWTRLQITLPGIQIDWTKAGFSQSLMPKDYHFDLTDGTVVLEA